MQPVLATGKVRYAGEPIAMCVAGSRAEAEDMVAAIELELEPLAAVTDMLAARKAGSALVHEHWGDNLFLSTLTDVDFEAVKTKAAVSVTRELRTSRQAMSPLEGRAVLAEWNGRLGQLVVHSSTQQPHIVRSGLAECLGIDEGQIRVIAPDVGGGFGYKGILLVEEVALAWATRKLRAAFALARGSSRGAVGQCQLPRTPLHPHRLRRRQRSPAGAGLRGHRRFGRLLGVSVFGLSRGRPDRFDPARRL